jgi:dihydropteroate synthase
MTRSATDQTNGNATIPPRVATWRLRTRDVTFTHRPLLMGIINVTPDSFSDGGRFQDAGRAIAHGLRLAAEGAEVLDVGGESTRPYAAPVDADEELRRVLPVVQGLCRQTSIPVSIDTSKAVVAREALGAGAEIINDVTGLEGDQGMLQVAVESGAGLCVMHMQGTPQTMQDQPAYRNVVEEIRDYLRVRLEALLAAGVEQRRICLDPGIGFGKTHQHNLTLLAACGRYHELGCPLLIGPSRKGFIGRVLGQREADRRDGTIGVCLALARQGIQVLRVHDVEPVLQALLLFDAVGGITGRPLQLPP